MMSFHRDIVGPDSVGDLCWEGVLLCDMTLSPVRRPCHAWHDTQLPLRRCSHMWHGQSPLRRRSNVWHHSVCHQCAPWFANQVWNPGTVTVFFKWNIATHHPEGVIWALRSRSQLWHDSSTSQRAFSRISWLRHLWEGIRMGDVTQSRDVLMLETTQSPIRRCSLGWHDSVTCQKALACVACLRHCVHLEGVLTCDMTPWGRNVGGG